MSTEIIAPQPDDGLEEPPTVLTGEVIEPEPGQDEKSNNDRDWLTSKIAAMRTGFDRGFEAAGDIFRNWEKGRGSRNISRFYVGKSYGEFIRETLGYPLAVEDALAILPGASIRELAVVTGKPKSTVGRARKQVSQSGTPEQAEATVVGKDGKSYKATRTTKTGATAPTKTLPKNEVWKAVMALREAGSRYPVGTLAADLVRHGGDPEWVALNIARDYLDAAVKACAKVAKAVIE